MKIRSDFVSNSSSSSFIVIADTTCETEDLSRYNDACTGKFVVPNLIGKTEFGWEFENTYDFFGKLNFCAMQCHYSNDYEKYFDMLHKVVFENFKLDIEMVPLRKSEYGGKEYWHLPDLMYIDHQSNASEDSCMEMFESEDTLLRFLSNEDSYVRGGNDNV